MSTALHYKSDLRDLFFNLFEFYDIGRTSLGKAPFGAMDETTAKEALTAFEKLCSTELAASFVEADHTPLQLDGDGNVTLPEALKTSMRTFYESGWHLLDLPEHLGGMGAPPSVRWAAFELLVGSNAPLGFYVFGGFIATIIDRLATDAQKKRFVENMVEHHWGGTMVLTEPDAGSDVGAARTKARHLHDDVWEIEGVKRFITNGDFDFAPNIVHLVLARPEGAGPGTKGLSMFIVPKWWVDEDGRLTDQRNGVYVTHIEKKMGIKASATCELTFGERGQARGLLVGNVHDGIRQMFHVIEHARMAIGMKSMATLSTAYLNALAFAKERVQGADLLRSADKSAPRVRIIQHPDVRRMLMLQKAHAHGMRAMGLFLASIQDQVEIQGGHGASDAAVLDRLNDLLLPLLKGYNSEKTYELLGVALQCFGGSGYLQDYPIEQYIRDQKIDTLYEGTTAIQALDFFFRKVARDGGETLRYLFEQVKATLKENAGGEALAAERAAVGRAASEIEAMLGTMMEKVGESLYHVGLQGNRILFAVAETTIGWLLLRQAAVALERKKVNPEDAAFYDGKIAAARFFCREVLPNVTLARKLVEASSLELMELPEEAF
ncbi:MAG: acyl-CoA dehydrogenase [Myxococcaceae bacterium]|nr:acyl-CoA dehydrogenase [Myxococcaceae bacterium]